MRRANQLVLTLSRDATQQAARDKRVAVRSHLDHVYSTQKMDEAELRVAVERELCTLLGDAFSSIELRRWLALLGPNEQQVLDQLPPPEIPHAEYVFQVVQSLKRRRMLDGRFFDNLELARPHRTHEIRDLRQRALATPNISSARSLLVQMEPLLDADLHLAFALTFAQTIRENKERISTKRLIAAILRIVPDISSCFSSSSLPTPTPASVQPDENVFKLSPPVSSCVKRSLSGLSSKLTALQELSPTDIFVDLAKFGTSPVIRQMRVQGITAQEIDTVSDLMGWKPITR